MSKKTLFFIIITTTLVGLVFILLIDKYPCKFTKTCLKYNNLHPNFSFNDPNSEDLVGVIGKKDIKTEKSDKYCELDSDCSPVSVACGDCGLEVVNKSFVNKYKTSLDDFCRDISPKIACDLDYRGLSSIKCIDNYCGFISKSAQEENIKENGVANCEIAGDSADEYSFGHYVGPKECCAGLEKIPLSELVNGKCLSLPDSGTVCSDCGNGVCEKWENPCNCEEDCI